MAYTTKKSLIEAISGGDEISWENFYTVYRPLVCFIAGKYGLSSCETEDLLQTVMLKCFKAGKSFVYDRANGKFRDYLGRIINNAIIDTFRSDNREFASRERYLNSESAGPEELPFETVWQQEWQQHLLAQAVEQLRNSVNEVTFQAFELTVLEECRPQEVAKFLNVPVNTVYDSKRRCLNRLREIVRALSEE